LIEKAVIGEVLGLYFLPGTGDIGDGEELDVGELAFVFG
jgi:hypothetical protein